MARRTSKRGSGSESENTTETPTEDVSSTATDTPDKADAGSPEGTDPTPESAETSDAPNRADTDETSGDTPARSDDVEDAEILGDDSAATEHTASSDTEPHDTATEDTAAEENTATEDTATGDVAATATTDSADGTDRDTAADADGSSDPDTTTDTTPVPMPQTVVKERGPGFVPLVLGGVVAAGLGYLAASSDILPWSEPPGVPPEIEAQLTEQSEALAALRAEIDTLASAEAPTVDLGPVEDSIDALGGRIDETAATLDSLTDRVVTLEERPVFTGDVTEDTAEAAEAIAALEEQMREREEEAAARAAEIEANARAAEAAAAAAQAEAEAAMAAAEAEAAAAAAQAEAEASIAELRLAITRGETFADPLADVAEVAEVPESLQARADAGVPSLEALQDSFPAAARAALPIALRESAGDNPVDRFSAFLQGQIGGRAVEPREGDSPDAILSRAQGHVTDGNLAAALDEISALPEGARAEMSGWIADAEARVDVMTALDTVTQTLSGGN